MHDGFFVSTARTLIGKAYRGIFKDLEAASLVVPAIGAELKPTGLSGGEIEETILGSSHQKLRRAAKPFSFSGRG